MSPVFEAQSGSNKLTPTKGQKLAEVIVGATLDDVGLYNWGTKEKAEINRALVELVGCQKVDPADPLQSELDPALGTGGAIYLPKAWTPTAPLDIGKTHTFKLKKRLPMPAVAITELTPWFTPNSATKCEIKYRVEGHASRADKIDLEVHVARYRDRQGKSQSSYYEQKETRRDNDPLKPALVPNVSQPANPTEYNDVPCGTDGPDDTHIWRDKKTGVAPSPVEVTASWDGESQATQGVLGPPKSGGKPYINSMCAPYSVLVRYYKDDADKVATIIFDESFYPRWKVEVGGTRKMDATSLVVRWTVKHGPSEKLVHGRLQVFAKNKPNPVFEVGIDKTKLKAGANELDLAPLWPESEIKRDDLPYRVQIQAHSGPDEAEGLAIAVMPTQVRAPDYKRVQFLAFNVMPPSPYKGDPVHRTDVAERCTAMIEAIQNVTPRVVPDTDVLKIFMAPEFYWRGPAGAYPVDEIEPIVPKLRAESDKLDYADWMFVFGTAIGQQQHGGTTVGSEIVHKTYPYPFKLERVSDSEVIMKPDGTEVLEPPVGWRVRQGTKTALITNVVTNVKWKQYTLTLAPSIAWITGDATIEKRKFEVLAITPPLSLLVTSLRVKSETCSQIPRTAVGGKLWKIVQGGVTSEITACARIGLTDEFNLSLKSPGPFRAGKLFELIEPMATEVTNVALVQKGYPSPYMGDGGLRHVAIYKENVSPIDFKTSSPSSVWHSADGSKRVIDIHGTVDRPVLPTEGADDLLGASPQTTRSDPTKTAGSEINTTGIGGGVVFTMDDITFGLEVCLDHDKNRLSKFYAGTNKTAGDPKVQVHLIPSWGSSIGSGDICCPVDGPVFNVDGQRANSAARVYDGTWSCDIHPSVTGARGNTCATDERHYWCPACAAFQGNAAGTCDFGHASVALVAYKKCGAPKYYGCSSSGCGGLSAPCTHAGAAAQYVCTVCNTWLLVGTTCACPNPKPVAVLCDTFYIGTNCPTCTKANTLCNHTFQKLGSLIATRGAVAAVPTATAKSFQRRGSVRAYEPVDLPLPDIVP
jgi:hypothetical protein